MNLDQFETAHDRNTGKKDDGSSLPTVTLYFFLGCITNICNIIISSGVRSSIISNITWRSGTKMNGTSTVITYNSSALSVVIILSALSFDGYLDVAHGRHSPCRNKSLPPVLLAKSLQVASSIPFCCSQSKTNACALHSADALMAHQFLLC